MRINENHFSGQAQNLVMQLRPATKQTDANFVRVIKEKVHSIKSETGKCPDLGQVCLHVVISAWGVKPSNGAMSPKPHVPMPPKPHPHVPISDPKGVLVLWIGDLMEPCPHVPHVP